ncbi:MAG: Abi family protein [Peptostreptococcaceae bacterium]|nr:Abi family protein [Peptostreptococcaceae bacterium]
MENYRPKLSISGQVAHMKSQGIKFEVITEDEAFHYLENNNYYFKIKSYNKLFEKYQYTDKKGKYVNLDFGYLVELAVLDMHLRHFILKTCVDLEHTIKVKFLRDFNYSKSDGYEIVEEYFNLYPEAKTKIREKGNSRYCADLITKLEKEHYALWSIVEVLSFGDFINLYELFYDKFPNSKNEILFTYPMRNIKNIRNAAAHNSCILNQFTEDCVGININRKVVTYLSKIKTIGTDQRISCMKKQVVHDFVTMIYVIDKSIESEGLKKKIIEELNLLVNVRIIKHKEYFIKNSDMKTVYEFIKKVVDNLSNE